MTDGPTEESVPRQGRASALLSSARIGQFASVGAVGALVDVTVLMILTEVFGVLPELAALVGIEAAILVMFAINERWTFATEGQAGSRQLVRRLGRSHGVRVVGTIAHLTVFVIVYRVFFTPVAVGDVNLWLAVAKGFGILTGGVLNYTFESLLTWRVHVEE